METRSEMARLWLYGNHDISSKVKYYLILRYGTAEQAMEQSVPELEKELAKLVKKAKQLGMTKEQATEELRRCWEGVEV